MGLVRLFGPIRASAATGSRDSGVGLAFDAAFRAQVDGTPGRGDPAIFFLLIPGVAGWLAIVLRDRLAGVTGFFPSLLLALAATTAVPIAALALLAVVVGGPPAAVPGLVFATVAFPAAMLIAD